MLDKIIEVKVNRKELEKVLKEMSLFDSMKQEIEQLHADENKLDEQQVYIETQLQELQQKYTENMVQQETAGIVEVVQLKIEAKKMTEQMEIMDSLLAEVKEAKQELMYTYYIQFRDALSKASTNASQYDFTPIFTKAIAELLAVAKEVGEEAEKQYDEVYPDISYVLFDNKVQERYPRIMSTYDPNRYKPRFNWNEKTVLTKEQVQYAILHGQLPYQFKAKEVAQGGE